MLYQLSYASVLPFSGKAPDKQNSPCELGQLLRLAQGTCPCNRPSIRPNPLNRFVLTTELGLQLATPAGPVGWGILQSAPAPSRRSKAVISSLSNFPRLRQFSALSRIIISHPCDVVAVKSGSPSPFFSLSLRSLPPFYSANAPLPMLFAYCQTQTPFSTSISNPYGFLPISARSLLRTASRNT